MTWAESVIGPEWAQGRAIFGGVLVSVCAKALPRDREIQGLTAQFIAPVLAGPVRVEHVVLRQGRALTHHELRLFQGPELCVVVAATTASHRPSQIQWPPMLRPDGPPAESLVPLPYIEGVTPRFTQQFDYRWAEGHMPFTGASEAHFGGWVRFADQVPTDLLGGLSLLDAWPAPVLPLLNSPAPASTAQWMVNLHASDWTRSYTGWWRFRAKTLFAVGGMVTFDAELWAPDGMLFGTSRQLVTEFSGRG